MTTILVLDDDKTFTGLVRTVFELEGYHAEILSRPDDTIAAAQRIKPALVLMDVHAGRGDTLDVLRRLTTDDVTRSIPVIMTSGMDRREECMQAGACAFILKPFRPTELLAVVSRFLNTSDADESCAV